MEEFQKKSEDPHLWDDPKQAQQLMKSLSDLRDEINLWTSLERRISDTLELSSMEDPTLNDELELETRKIKQELERLSLSTLLGGKYDRGNALLTINTGEGGTDAQDWAGMLERMYLRWCERKGYQTEILDQTEGEEAGIKTVSIAVSGNYAYGYLRAEKGVHRLVRLSPYDSAHRRHTSFAQVEVLPEAAQEDPLVVINPDEVKIDIYKSSGAGGQNVQKNATAIRLTHLPTGIVVTCQNERSQMQNRENAMRVLRSRLLDLAQIAQDKNLSDLRGIYQKAEWGSQIRSYVLHPYQMVKDHRTEYEVGNSMSVLDGELDGFIEAYLKFNK
ncbi:MAG: peptide chain release factor 2 [Chloroflexi bacterium]|nr:MAG: peptide chain release factor 2 [Chloroflexota bacterium]